MQINLMKFGTGIRPLSSGNPMNVPPASGKLKMMAGNIEKAGTSIKKTVEQANQKVKKFAASSNNSVNIKA